ncbi:Dps family protein [Oxalobacter paraformigenes]|uniref:Ferritin/DPS domain-containing protein n=1 Tax=Oxalobacter paraformigenes TaxID=556268 RepID=C3X1D2_9BURK|nr:DNA starvation/stationary phase protection protein [Oxalobacter paraformigenes]EEO27018.2 hypothetical protein OFAG_00171 [Oxalobacter paraformigenes]
MSTQQSVETGSKTINKIDISGSSMKKSNPVSRLCTTSDLSAEGITKIQQALNPLLADVFALYLKTKNFHWHLSGPHFRDYHLMFDEHADQLFDMTDDIAERVRKLGAQTLHSISEISKEQRIKDNNEPYVDPLDMLNELKDDNLNLLGSMRDAHEICDENKDVATASLLENWIDETERRIWFLFEAAQDTDSTGH